MGLEAQATGAMFVALMRTVASAIERLGETPSPSANPPHLILACIVKLGGTAAGGLRLRHSFYLQGGQPSANVFGWLCKSE